MAITNLTGTNWLFNESVTTNTGLGTYNINFTSNGQNFVRIYATYRGYIPVNYYDSENILIQAYKNSVWLDEAYRTIEISGGADVENADLIAFLQANAVQIIPEPPTFSETKTALKIYEDLTEEEFSLLEKEPNSFYLVNDVGLYKGEKLIATNVDTKAIPTDVNIVEDQGAWQIQLEHDSNVLSLTDLTPFDKGLVRFKKFRLTLKSGTTWEIDGAMYMINGESSIEGMTTCEIDNTLMYYIANASSHGGFYCESNTITIIGGFFNFNKGGISTGAAVNLKHFIWDNFSYFNVTYPGSTTINVHRYVADTIDLTTGGMKARVNTITASNLIYELTEVTD